MPNTAARGYRSAISAVRTHRTLTAQRKALLADVSAFTTPADLTDLAEILKRHDDRDAATVRNAVDWTRAA